MSTELLKKLKIELNHCEEKLSVINHDIKSKQKEKNFKIGEINRLKNQIGKIREKEIHVSDHAVLRYLERIQGINIEDIKDKILTKKVIEMIETLGGNGKYPNNDFQLVVKNNKVVTIIKK